MERIAQSSLAVSNKVADLSGESTPCRRVLVVCWPCNCPRLKQLPPPPARAVIDHEVQEGAHFPRRSIGCCCTTIRHSMEYVVTSLREVVPSLSEQDALP